MVIILYSDEEKVEATILYNLRKKKIIGAAHTHFDTLKKGFPSHLGGDISKSAKKLIKKSWIVTKPTSYGLQVSLNKKKLKEIEKYIKKILDIGFV